MIRLLIGLAFFIWTVSAHAHKPSDSYLSLSVKENVVAGQWDIALRDLDFAIGLDTDANGAITWGELRSRRAEIEAYALSRLQISSAGSTCPLRPDALLVDNHTDGAYAVLQFQAQCAAVRDSLQVRYRLFFDIDPQHKGLLRLQYQGASSTGIFSPDKADQPFSLSAPSRLQQFLDYLREGIWHIWIGYDHILFLLALLLPAVAMREAGAWKPVSAFRPAFWNVLRIVTAFTVAHSITLTLATLGVVSLPSRWVESTIAASVVIAALNNVFPLFRERRWVMAFLFGLIHGFGFASVLSDLGLPQDALVLALVGFNVGVEVGQLAIVAAFLPLIYLLRRSWLYRRLLLLGGSILIAILASIWLIERAANIRLLSF
ncbi:HupE/UreJ family protein [Noviherbaspirillum sp. 1P10PC]|uniref:HupE/UreJ family protein n=1 Tax=Noviherbaspirillum sp. 1P10PC TaxID=3132292 RepID=UPI0039A2BD0E